MDARKRSSIAWLLLTFTLPTKRASQRVEEDAKVERRTTTRHTNVPKNLPFIITPPVGPL